MKILVGGESRKCGKTTLVTFLLRRFPQRHWLAVKVTQHKHGRQHPTGGDTARYLHAGAAEVRLIEGQAPHALAELVQITTQWPDWIVEGTSVSGAIVADCRLLVRSATRNPKPSASDVEFRPDAYVGTMRDDDLVPCFVPDSEDLVRFLLERWK